MTSKTIGTRGMTATDHKVLAAVHSGFRQTSAIADALGISPSQASTYLGRLVSHALIRRVKNGEYCLVRPKLDRIGKTPALAKTEEPPFIKPLPDEMLMAGRAHVRRRTA